MSIRESTLNHSISVVFDRCCWSDFTKSFLFTLYFRKKIEPKDDFPSEELFKELLRDRHLLISDNTRRYIAKEFYVPGKVIDRANRGRWALESGLSLAQRAHSEVQRHLKEFTPSSLPDDVKKQLVKLMEAESKRFGREKLRQRTNL